MDQAVVERILVNLRVERYPIITRELHRLEQSLIVDAVDFSCHCAICNRAPDAGRKLARPILEIQHFSLLMVCGGFVVSEPTIIR